MAETGTYQWMLTDPDPVESSISRSDARLSWLTRGSDQRDLANDKFGLSPASSDMIEKPDQL